MYLGPHLAITSLRQHVLHIPLRQSSAHSREQHYDFKALEFGKQRRCLLLQRQGCGTAPHGCQDLLTVLHKLILKGSRVLGASIRKALGGSGTGSRARFGYVRWKRWRSKRKGHPTTAPAASVCLNKAKGKQTKAQRLLAPDFSG